MAIIWFVHQRPWAGLAFRRNSETPHNVHLFEVKRPDESRQPWDFYKLVRTSPADEGFRPLEEGGCPLVRS